MTFALAPGMRIANRSALLLISLLLALGGCVSPMGGEGALGEDGKADSHGGDGAAECVEPPESEVELKVTIDEASIDDALAALELSFDDAETRFITYYDSPDLDLYEAGIILRTRDIVDDEDDSTIKLRPMLAEEMWATAPDFFFENDFKCEIDRSVAGQSSACSLKDDQNEGEIADVAAGERDIDKLFNGAQEDMLELFGPAGFDLNDDAMPLGPVDTLRWEYEPDEFPYELTVERWEMPDGGLLLELSIKVDQDEADEAMEALLDYVDGLSIPLSETQGSKTSRVLNHFSGRSRR